MATASNVTAGKPLLSGALFTAPKGSALPTDASSDLGTDFVSVGYISEDGVTNANSTTTESIKAWGGDTVLNILTEKEDTFSFTMIETLNVEAMKVAFGTDNVTGDLTNGITVKVNSADPDHRAWVVELVTNGGNLKRIVIPDATVTEVGDITYSDSEAVGYEVTLTCLPDADGNTHYEYIGG